MQYALLRLQSNYDKSTLGHTGDTPSSLKNDASQNNLSSNAFQTVLP